MTSSKKAPAPVLKWAGGKRALLAQYEPFFPKVFKNYHEPFLGGGAVYFFLYPRLKGQAFLSDTNAELINLYATLQHHVTAVVRLLKSHKRDHSEIHYREVRAQVPSELDEIERAARLIYLNRTCYNGLYRVNRKGQFNVPIGRYTDPKILDEPRLRAAGRVLRKARLFCSSYHEVLKNSEAGDLVYLDPPYAPLNATSSFTSYTASNFSEADQADLADVFRELSRRGVHAMLSNSHTESIVKLYSGFDMHEILAPRMINSKAGLRSGVGELLICNFRAELDRNHLTGALAGLK